MRLKSRLREKCGVLYFVRSLITATVRALHRVASGHTNLPPHHHSSCGFLGRLHNETAVAQRERWCNVVQDSW